MTSRLLDASSMRCQADQLGFPVCQALSYSSDRLQIGRHGHCDALTTTRLLISCCRPPISPNGDQTVQQVTYTTLTGLALASRYHIDFLSLPRPLIRCRRRPPISPNGDQTRQSGWQQMEPVDRLPILLSH